MQVDTYNNKAIAGQIRILAAALEELGDFYTEDSKKIYINLADKIRVLSSELLSQ